VLVGLVSALILFVIGFLMRGNKVYLIDFAVLHPEDKYIISHEKFMVRNMPKKKIFFFFESANVYCRM